MFVFYAKAITYIITFTVVFFAFLVECVLIYSRIWLAQWSSKTNITSAERDLFIGVYGALGIGQGFCVLISALFLVYGAYLASNKLHNQLLDNILRSPMSFFETTPIGRIVNRFSKDINTIDEAIPRSIRSFLATFFSMLGTIFVIAYSTPLFLAVLLPLSAMYFFTQVRLFVNNCNVQKTFIVVHILGFHSE